MPCLNEAETLKICIQKAQGYLHSSGVCGEVLIADNGSDDGSQDIARQLGARVVHAETMGYGAALLEGIKSARGQYIIMGDSDNSYDFSNLGNFLAALRDGADLVMGNRFKGGIAKNAMPPLHRYLGNPVLSLIGRLLFRSPIGDFHCGLRGFSREAIAGLRLQATGMEFASEMVVKASIMQLKVVEVPATLAPDGRSRPPHLRSWRDGWAHLKLLLSFAPRWLFFYPGVTLFFTGLIMILGLSFGPLSIVGVRFDNASLIIAVAIFLTGSQLMGFYALARLHALKSGLLSSTAMFDRLRNLISVDRACLFGALSLLVGILFALFAVSIWAGAGYGDLEAGVIVRPAAISVALISFGVQIVTGGFMWGLIDQTYYKAYLGKT